MHRLFLTAFLVLLAVPVVAHAAVVNINTAGVAELDTLPGIGPAKAAAIIDYRTTNGPFARTEDIVNVKGVGPATYENLKAFIVVTGVSTPAPAAKPPVTKPSSYVEQTPSSAVTSTNKITHAEDGVNAPETTSELAASGAAMPTVRAFLSSPWAIGFLGLLVLAGGALLIL